MKKIIIFGIVAIFIGGCIGQGDKDSKLIVEKGDTVYINYIGRLENGEVFDTSYENVAKNESIRKAPFFYVHRAYNPLKFSVGHGEVIPGLDEAVIGMKIGEEKTVVIPPEKGYGLRNLQLIYNVSRKQDIPRMITFKIEDFVNATGEEPVVGKVVKPPTLLWNLTVVNITGGNVTVSQNLEIGMSVKPSNTPWNITVLNLTEETITIRYDAVENTYFPTWEGIIKVQKVDEENITLDHNFPLAGKTMIFEFIIEDIVKGMNISSTEYPTT